MGWHARHPRHRTHCVKNTGKGGGVGCISVCTRAGGQGGLISFMSDPGAGCSRPTVFGALSCEGRWGRLCAWGWDGQTLAGAGCWGQG